MTTKGTSGSVTITATLNDGSGIYGKIDLVVPGVFIKVGEVTSIGNSSYVKYSSVEWKIEDETIVNKTGKQGYIAINNSYKHNIEVKGLNEGKTKVEMLTPSGNLIASSTIYVYNPIISLSSDVKEIFMAKGETTKLNVSVNPSKALENKLFYTSEDENVAKVDDYGNITATGKGKTNVVVYSQYYDAKLVIPVDVVVYATGINLKETEINLSEETQKYKIEYSIEPNDVSNGEATFTSFDENIVQVDKAGIITAINNGTTIITVKTADEKISKEIKVNVSGLKKDINKLEIEEIKDYTYTGIEVKPEVVIKNGKYTLLKNRDYTLDYKNNINAGEAKIIIKGINDYKGTKELKFNIKNATIEFNCSDKEVLYDGNEYTIDLNVTNPVNTTIKYADLNGEYVLDDAPKYSKAGIYTIKYQIMMENYETVRSENVLKILKHIDNITLSENNITIENFDKYSLKASISPSDTTDSKEIKWTSNNENIVKVDNNGNIEAKSVGTAIITAITSNGKKAICNVTIKECQEPTIEYRTHIQNIGWQGYMKNGEMSGTSGQSKRLEGINVKLSNSKYSGSIEYRTHVQNYGWQDYVKDDAMSGTSGQSKRLEAIQIKLTGELSKHYDVYYRVHCQNIGWMNWAKNDEKSGTAGYSYRLEAIEIVILKKGEEPPYRSCDYQDSFKSTLVTYRTHVEYYGWQNYVNDGAMSGTSGQSKRLEGINISLSNIEYSGSIEYRTHVQDYGWQDYVRDGEMAGTSGQSKRLEAIQIRLTGEVSKYYDVYYRVHCQNIGWMNWAKNDEKSGTAGYSYRLEAIEIVIVKKGEKPPYRSDINTISSFM